MLTAKPPPIEVISESRFRFFEVARNQACVFTPRPTTSYEPLSLEYGAFRPIPFSTVHNAFRFHAITQPASVALQHIDLKMSYCALDVASSRLAATLLVTYGIQRGSRVCLVTRRGIPMVVAILAILKSGGVYIPIDGGIATDSTLEYVIHDSSPTLVLASRSFMPRLSSLASGVHACLDDLISQTPPPRSDRYLETTSTSEDDAYIIYTSGTTGKPKGVVVTHGNLTNLLCLFPGNLGMRPGMHVSQLLNVAFDMCAWEVLGSLMNGCSLHIRGSDRSSWESTLQSVDLVIATPSILALYDPSNFPNIKIVAVAGEPCPQSLATRWSKHATFYNCCGPTETTIVNTISRHEPGHPLTIGRPTPNNNVYILDEDMRPVPRGKTGTIWAGGAGISKGYINLPEHTGRLFKPDVFSATELMYNTGDLGRMRSDGEIEHLGRIDDQVKVKGFRVELDGITAVICSCPSVSVATTFLVGQEIVSILAPDTANLDEVRSNMQASLPYYAIPKQYIVLPSLPLTLNGKVDKARIRKLLASVTRGDGDDTTERPAVW
ncbi:non-ribosomal peptide synthase [Pleurotus eryngii]|uniref:Non-ribosomal peptide synthase n=1 Tax=Pleurotus eryngii TaxID=5323 RepID=A0A9P6A1M2_PLEER|nr:non-ribosomal peptide synthase [Pleurotus eryngii]